MALPVGSIIASILRPDDFKAHMPAGEHWELADGTAVPKGTLQSLIQNNAYYKLLNPNNVAKKPNLQGVFLRGKNNKRDDNKGSPNNQDLEMGAYQEDDIGPHTHTQTVGYANAAAEHQGDGWHGQGSTTTGNPDSGGLETRPRNVTVNFYIRVG